MVFFSFLIPGRTLAADPGFNKSMIVDGMVLMVRKISMEVSFMTWQYCTRMNGVSMVDIDLSL